ncbi:hypothetical protein ACFL32_00905 [Candidatus Neomarinimicrobiota bacterium]
MRVLALILCCVAFIYPQDLLETKVGSIFKGQLIEITDTHIVFKPENSIAPQHIPRSMVQTIVLETGEVVFKEVDLIQPSENAEIDSTIIARITKTVPYTSPTPPSLEESMATIAKAHQTIALVYQIFLGITIASIVLSILLASG